MSAERQILVKNRAERSLGLDVLDTKRPQEAFSAEGIRRHALHYFTVFFFCGVDKGIRRGRKPPVDPNSQFVVKFITPSSKIDT